MFFNLVIVSLLAAATARTIPGNCGPHLVPPPTDFPRRPPLRQTPESRGTGVIGDQDNGEAIPQEKPGFDEYRRVHDHRNHDNRRPIYHDQPKYFDNFGPGNDGAQDNSGIIEQEKPYFDGVRLKDDRALNNTQDSSKKVPEKPPRGRHFDNFDLGTASEHKSHNNIQHTLKTNKNVTEKRDPESVKVAVIDYHNHKDSLDNRSVENQPKTKINSTDLKTSIDNEVFLEGRTIESALPGNGSDDRWIWGDTTTTISSMDLDNRAAFDGGKCPSGQVRVKGSDACVDIDED